MARRIASFAEEYLRATQLVVQRMEEPGMEQRLNLLELRTETKGQCARMQQEFRMLWKELNRQAERGEIDPLTPLGQLAGKVAYLAARFKNDDNTVCEIIHRSQTRGALAIKDVLKDVDLPSLRASTIMPTAENPDPAIKAAVDRITGAEPSSRALEELYGGKKKPDA